MIRVDSFKPSGRYLENDEIDENKYEEQFINSVNNNLDSFQYTPEYIKTNIGIDFVIVFIDLTLADPFKDYVYENMFEGNSIKYDIFCTYDSQLLFQLFIHENKAMITVKNTLINNESLIIEFKFIIKELINTNTVVMLYDSINKSNFIRSGSDNEQMEEIRCLNNEFCKNNCDDFIKLEVGNIIKGLSASIFNYCQSINVGCYMFVALREAMLNESSLKIYFQTLKLIEIIISKRFNLTSTINLKSYISRDKYLSKTEILYT